MTYPICLLERIAFMPKLSCASIYKAKRLALLLRIQRFKKGIHQVPFWQSLTPKFLSPPCCENLFPSSNIAVNLWEMGLFIVVWYSTLKTQWSILTDKIGWTALSKMMRRTKMKTSFFWQTDQDRQSGKVECVPLPSPNHRQCTWLWQLNPLGCSLI